MDPLPGRIPLINLPLETILPALGLDWGKSLPLLSRQAVRFLPVPGALGLQLKWGRCCYRSYGKTELSLEEGQLTGFGPLLRIALKTPALSPNPPDNYVSPFPSH